MKYKGCNYGGGREVLVAVRMILWIHLLIQKMKWRRKRFLAAAQTSRFCDLASSKNRCGGVCK